MNDQENLPREDEDVEAHRVRPATNDTDEVEGHRMRPAVSDDDGDDDVEAHRLKVGGP